MSNPNRGKIYPYRKRETQMHGQSGAVGDKGANQLPQAARPENRKKKNKQPVQLSLEDNINTNRRLSKEQDEPRKVYNLSVEDNINTNVIERVDEEDEDKDDEKGPQPQHNRDPGLAVAASPIRDEFETAKYLFSMDITKKISRYDQIEKKYSVELRQCDRSSP